MLKIIKVYLDDIQDGKKVGRKIVEAELVQRNNATVLVKLSDGHIISRKIKRDLVDAI